MFSTAQLKTGSGNSGKLVTEVKKQLSAAAPPEAKLAVVDGSPGIGCPVIASLSGADMVLIVAEPSLSGISDMERIIGVAHSFGIKIAVCINKYDISRNNTETIKDYCRQNNIFFAGLVPFDQQAVRAVNQGMAVVDAKCPSGLAVKAVFDKVMACLES